MSVAIKGNKNRQHEDTKKRCDTAKVAAIKRAVLYLLQLLQFRKKEDDPLKYRSLDRLVSIEHVFIIIVLQHYHYRNDKNINSYTS